MTYNELSGFISKISEFLSDKHYIHHNPTTSGKFLDYLVHKDFITREEANNTIRFYINREEPYTDLRNQLYFTLIQSLYNKHIKQLENDLDTKMEQKST